MNPLFDANYYLSTNPDVRARFPTAAEAWNHYITWGANEAFVAGGMTRRPNSYFDVRFYLYNPNNDDLWRGSVTPSSALDHYYRHGRSEGRAPNASAPGK